MTNQAMMIAAYRELYPFAQGLDNDLRRALKEARPGRSNRGLEKIYILAVWGSLFKTLAPN